MAPFKSKKICPKPNCNIVIPGNESHCPGHKPTTWKIKREYNPFYSSVKWKRTTRAYLSAHPLCVHCKKKGRDTIAKHTDHIKPIEQGGALYDWINLQGLCIPCHSSKTAKEIRNK